MEAWRGIWRSLKNGGSFRGPPRVDFLHLTFKFWSRGPYGSPPVPLELSGADASCTNQLM
jgi:hypothetical protein